MTRFLYRALLDAMHIARAVMNADAHASSGYYAPAYTLIDDADKATGNIADLSHDVHAPVFLTHDAEQLVAWLLAHPMS